MFGNPGYFLFYFLHGRGWLGQKAANMHKLCTNEHLFSKNNVYFLDKYSFHQYALPGIDCEKEIFTHKWQTMVNSLTKWEKNAREGYKKHNDHVMATVPSDRLLVWNLKVIIKLFNTV